MPFLIISIPSGRLKSDMDIQLVAMQSQLRSYDNTFKGFQRDVSAALQSADQFYEAVSGAQGVIQWLVANVPGVGIGSALCGKSTPSWCGFSKVTAAK